MRAAARGCGFFGAVVDAQPSFRRFHPADQCLALRAVALFRQSDGGFEAALRRPTAAHVARTRRRHEGFDLGGLLAR
ncbi:hypothetical protein BURMUCGD1_4006 [Burkholderia multivorans CGD1]|nr:hypothetical protein BURMUCGD1_4006 [Burkholderia multivorans CGD1]